jgi:predicted kinase
MAEATWPGAFSTPTWPPAATTPAWPCCAPTRSTAPWCAPWSRGCAPAGGAAQGPDYLACAERLAAPGARLLITYGLSGSGKSTAAAQLLQQGAVRLRSDVERKRLHGLAPLDDSAALGLDIYTSEASRRTFAQLAAQARALLAAGYPVIVDAAFLRRRERDAFHALARELGLPFAILHCHADPDRLRERVRQRRAAGGDPSEADLAVLARQQQQAEPLAPEEQQRTLDLATDQAWDAPALVPPLAVRSGLMFVNTNGGTGGMLEP